MKKLATIQRITNIRPIEGKDLIAQASVLGWNLIIAKKDFKEGDLCVYLEIGSVLKPNPAWDFMEKSNWKVKTMKMAGTISQGLALPLSVYYAITGKSLPKGADIGTDLTEELGITKLVPKEDNRIEVKKHGKIFNYLMRYSFFRNTYLKLFGKSSGSFPTNLMPETDEVNIQSLPDLIEAMIGKCSMDRSSNATCSYHATPEEVYVTEKLEGQSASYALYKKKGIFNTLLGVKEFFVCSHHFRKLHDDNSNWWQIAKSKKIEDVLKRANASEKIHYGIQGEIIGPKIQGNIYKLTELDLYIFNVWNLDTQERLNVYDAVKFCERYNLKFVPIIGGGRLESIIPDPTPQKILEYSNGMSKLNKNVFREGVVVRTNNMKLSFKARSPKYLLKQDPEKDY